MTTEQLHTQEESHELWLKASDQIQFKMEQRKSSYQIFRVVEFILIKSAPEQIVNP